MNERHINLLISAGAAIILILVLFLGYMITPTDSWASRFFVMFGGRLPSGLIQGFSYFLFFYGYLEIRRMNRSASKEEEGFTLGLLPETEQYVLSAEDINQLKLKMIEVEKKHPIKLVELIKKGCTKFRANKSVTETLGVVSTQANIHLRDSESEQSLIRYIAWAIPSVGFIGTVIGIAASLGVANEVVNTEGIQKVSSLLSIAVDTTLVALILSIILMYYFHALQERVEKLHSRMEDYILENFVNRIYHR